MKVSLLASGSKGNALYIEGDDGALLIDAGFSARELLGRLEKAGGRPDSIQAILVTHEHVDHIRGVDVLARRLQVPVVATAGTLSEFLENRRSTSRTLETRKCIPGTEMDLGQFSFTPFRTLHDACEPCGFIVSDGNTSFGCCTDTGSVSEYMLSNLRRCDALALESNHCPQMLAAGPYPPFLKRRIRDAKRGHLSNEAAAACLGALAENLDTVILAHLSEVNNTPEKARASATEGLGLFADETKVHVAVQHTATALIRVG